MAQKAILGVWTHGQTSLTVPPLVVNSNFFNSLRAPLVPMCFSGVAGRDSRLVKAELRGLAGLMLFWRIGLQLLSQLVVCHTRVKGESAGSACGQA